MIVVLSPKKTSPWFSCVSITENLLRTYEISFGTEYLSIEYDELTSVTIRELAKKIVSLKVKQLVLIDHLQGYLPIIKELSQSHPLFMAKLKIVIHIFGDFTLSAGTWCYYEKYLKGLSIKFLSASEKQCELIKNFLVNANSVAYQNFTVSDKDWNYKKKEIEDYYVYIGRISTTKNVDILCQYFAKFQKKHKKKTKLIICGGFDDLGAPYFGFHPPVGFTQTHFTYKILLNKEVAPYIEYVGFKNPNELKEILKSAKGFLSLSTYHDEDFGMAVAEALCMGVPVSLTDWAGYSSFKIDEELTMLNSVKFEESKILINYQDFEANLKKLELVNTNESKRKKLSQIARIKFGIQQPRLKELIESEYFAFEGFSLAYYYLEKTHCRFNVKAGLSDYYQIYRSYYGNS